MIITQLTKVTIEIVQGKRKKITVASLNRYGGMPSSHSALFASLIIVSGLTFGLTSFEFAISVILYLIMVRDAVGIRWHLGNHGAILKQLIKEHVKDNDDIEHDKIVTRLGHTPTEAFVGTIFGIVITALLWLLLN